VSFRPRPPIRDHRSSVAQIGLMFATIAAPTRGSAGDPASEPSGLMVLQVDAISPAFSSLPVDAADRLRDIPGIRVIAPEIYGMAPAVEGTRPDDLATAPEKFAVILGRDVVAHSRREGDLLRRSLLPGPGGGRFLAEGDRGKPHVVISRKLARIFAGGRGREKAPGDTLRVGDEDLRIVGVYETGSQLFDHILVMDTEVARRLLGVEEGRVSSFYVEAADPGRTQRLAEVIEARMPGLSARIVSNRLPRTERPGGDAPMANPPLRPDGDSRHPD